MGLITTLDQDLTDGLLTTTENLTQGAMDYAGPLFRTMVVIYFAIWGYILWTNAIQEPLRESIFRFLRITAVATIALQFAFYSDFIIGTAFNGPNEIVNGITGENNEAVEQIDDAWHDIRAKGNEAMESDASWYDMGDHIYNAMVAGVLWIGAFILCVPPFFLILLSKLVIGVLCVLGPIFIIMALFQKGVSFTQQWATQLVTYMMIYVVSLIVLRFASETVLELIHQGMDGKKPTIGIATEVMLISMVMMFAFTLVPAMAGGLAGGFAAPAAGLLSKIPAGRTPGRAMSRSATSATGRGIKSAGSAAGTGAGRAGSAAGRGASSAARRMFGSGGGSANTATRQS